MLLQKLPAVSLTRTTKPNPYRCRSLRQSKPYGSRRYLWGRQKASSDDSTNYNDAHMSPGTETSDSKLFAKGIGLATRMSAGRKFQCTQFDKNGEIYMGHGHIQRSEIVSKVSIASFRSSTKTEH
jgi:hypothetical protein